MPATIRYVAFLRGINVGGNKIIKMDDLKKMFDSMGFQKVKTIQAAGNILFDAPKSAPEKLSAKIERQILKEFSQQVGVIVRTVQEISDLIASNPFAKIKVTPATRLYVTFLSEKPKTTLKIPYSSPDGDFKILRATESELCSVLTVSEGRNTLDLMKIIEKEYGKKVTTRNWNTILKVAASRG